MDTGNEKCAQCPFVMGQETQIERLQKISQEISAGAASGFIIDNVCSISLIIIFYKFIKQSYAKASCSTWI